MCVLLLSVTDLLPCLILRFLSCFSTGFKDSDLKHWGCVLGFLKSSSQGSLLNSLVKSFFFFWVCCAYYLLKLLVWCFVEDCIPLWMFHKCLQLYCSNPWIFGKGGFCKSLCICSHTFLPVILWTHILSGFILVMESWLINQDDDSRCL